MKETIDLTAAINGLVQEMEEESEDLHEVHMRLLELLGQLRATGMPLPDDLVELEQWLSREVEGVDGETGK